jgi:GntR family transcriptional regulator / MocR family aminotransferase
MILNKSLNTPLYMQIYSFYKHAILENTLSANEKLPSIRQLALKHSLSKTTIEKAYNQLLIEGYIESYPKSGYYVAKLDLIKTKDPITNPKSQLVKSFINQYQSMHSFDLNQFKKCMQDIMHYEGHLLFEPLNPQGEYALRHEIRKHLNEERGVVCQSDQIIIASGTQNQLMNLAALTSKRRVAYLVPLFSRAKHVFDLLKFESIPCHTIDEMIQTKADFIYISPSNLYPSGSVLSVKDRLRLIRYAQENKAFIIEDDYNHIFRYNAALIPSIQGLAKGNHVIYIGSFSRNLLISMRMSYMVLPFELIKAYLDTPRFAQTVSKIDQLSLAKFMRDGHYKKHLRHLSHDSKKQNESIQSLIETYPFSEAVLTIGGLESNLHILFKVRTKSQIERIKERAKKYPVYIQTFEELPTSFLLPYSNLSSDVLKQVLDYIFT